MLTAGGAPRAAHAAVAGGSASAAALGGFSCQHVVRQALELGDVLEGQGEVGRQDALHVGVSEELDILRLPPLLNSDAAANSLVLELCEPGETLKIYTTTQNCTVGPSFGLCIKQEI